MLPVKLFRDETENWLDRPFSSLPRWTNFENMFDRIIRNAYLSCAAIQGIYSVISQLSAQDLNTLRMIRIRVLSWLRDTLFSSKLHEVPR